jgi:protein-S-isoprenylcysteine O-methyltransferase Ste14
MGTLSLVLASSLWGLVHSMLASIQVKGIARQISSQFASRWYRLAYNAFAGISFLPVLLLAALLPDRLVYAVPFPSPGLYLMMAGQLAALLMLLIGVLQTDTLAFIGIRQIVGNEAPGKLVTGGLYRYMRHPLYTAGLLFIWLTPTMTINRLTLYLCLTVYILIGAYFEERKLLREFGQEYQNYKARTPMLIPFLPKHL